MGVKSLWKLLEPAGRPVRLESLEGLILAVDISIWLNQAVKGMRTREGEPLPNAHLVVLFNRICKLLYYRIKPVFVFDGAMPTLKKKTLAARRRKRDAATQRSVKTANKQTSKYLQAKILEQMTGESSRVPIPAVVGTHRGEADMFVLPPLSSGDPKDQEEENEESEEDSPVGAESAPHYYHDLAEVDIHSSSFDTLPPEVQHELLLERQQLEKYAYHSPDSLPQVAEDFSSYQLSKLLQRSRTSKKLDNVRKVLKSNDTALVGLGEEAQVHEVESSRIVSSDSAHYILVRGMDVDSQSSASQTEEEEEGEARGRQPAGSGSGVGPHGYRGESDMDHQEMRQRGAGWSSGLRKGGIDEEQLDFGGAEIMSSSEEDEEAEFESLEGQLTLFEDVILSANRTSGQQGSSVSVVEGPHSSLVETPTSLVKPPSPPATSLVKPPSPPTSLVKTTSPPISLMKTTSPPTSLVEPPSPPTSLVKPSSPPTSLVKTASPLISLMKTTSPSTSLVEPPSSPTSLVEPPSLLTSLVTPPTSVVEPPSPPTSVTESPTSVTKPPSLPISDVELPSTSTSDAKLPPTLTSGGKPSLPSILDGKPSTPSTSIATASSLPTSDEKTSAAAVRISKAFSPDQGADDVSMSSGSSDDEFVTVEDRSITEFADSAKGSEVPHPSTDNEIDLPHPSAAPETDTLHPSSSEWAWSDEEEVEALGKMDARVAQEQLLRETTHLDKERRRQDRTAASVSDKMYQDAQDLLGLFGLPYVAAPSEAEAQCAALEASKLTQGSITDDSDVFLFGGEKVYRNFFSQDKDLELYHSSQIRKNLGLSRDKLVVLAYLLGSDYTGGIEGVGVVSAMEILRDFPGTQLEPLSKLKEWHQKVNLKPPLPKDESSLQRKLRLSSLAVDFPSPAVWKAFMEPEVDHSEETFEWGKPDLDLLRSFAASRIGWTEEKANQVLLPVLKRLNSAKPVSQPKLTQFFETATSSLPLMPQGKAIKSSRMRTAITRIKDHASVGTSSNLQRGRGTRGRGKRPAAAKRGPNKRAKNSKDRDFDFSLPKSAKPQIRKTKGRPPTVAPPISSSSSSSDGESEFDRIMRDM